MSSLSSGVWTVDQMALWSDCDKILPDSVSNEHDLLLVLNPLHALGAPNVLKLRFFLVSVPLASAMACISLWVMQ